MFTYSSSFYQIQCKLHVIIYLIINVLIYFYIIIRLHTYCKSENNKSSLPSKTKASLLCTNSTAAIGSVISNAAI
jgi:hypothetical protein